MNNNKKPGYDELINAEYFTVLKHYFVAFNNTSMTPILNYKQLVLVELSEVGCVLTMPTGKCTIGHSVTLFVSSNRHDVMVKRIPDNLTIENTTAITAKVVGLEKFNEKFILAHLLFTNTPKEWREIEDIYIERQATLSELLEEMKGFEQSRKREQAK